MSDPKDGGRPNVSDEPAAAPGSARAKEQSQQMHEEYDADYTDKRILHEALPKLKTPHAPRPEASDSAREEAERALEVPPAKRVQNPFLRVVTASHSTLRRSKEHGWVGKDGGTYKDTLDPSESQPEPEPVRPSMVTKFTGFGAPVGMDIPGAVSHDDLISGFAKEAPPPTGPVVPSADGSLPPREHVKVEATHPDVEQFVGSAAVDKILETPEFKMNPSKVITDVELKSEAADFISRREAAKTWWLEKMKDTPNKGTGQVLGWESPYRDAVEDEKAMMRQFGKYHRPVTPYDWKVHQSLEHRKKYLPLEIKVPRYVKWRRRAFRVGVAYAFIALPSLTIWYNYQQMDTSYRYSKTTDFSDEHDKMYAELKKANPHYRTDRTSAKYLF
eukprot:Rhum_TRINITY_DN23516_c0_g1::Rhum_TRINITY_DN23516_c0_g1_i1::g.178224::m.178224